MRESSDAGIRFHPSARRVVRFGPFRADLSDGSLWRDTGEVRLPPRALAILFYLVERPGRVVPKNALIDAVWKEANVSESSLTEALGLIRQALGDSAQHPTYIETLHRRGYRFIAPVSVDSQRLEHSTTDAVPAFPPAVQLAPAPEPAADTAAAPAPSRVRGWWRRNLAATIAGILGATAAGAVWAGWPSDPSIGAVTRVTITLAEQEAPAPVLTAHTVVALSPDGSELVYVAGSGSEYRLLIRRMDRFDAQPVPGTDGGHGPFFSPDGTRIGFFAGGRLKHVSRTGGDVVTLADAPDGLGATWTSDGRVVFAPERFGGLMEVGERGDAPAVLVSAGPSIGYRWPHALPDGDTIIATRWGHEDPGGTIVAISRSRRTETEIARGASYARYLPSGYLVFAQRNAIMAARFAPDSAPGAPTAIVEGVMTGLQGAAQFAVASSGTLIYIPDDPTRAHRTIRRVDSRSGQIADLFTGRPYQNLDICNGRIAVTINEHGASDLWIGRVAGGALTRLTSIGTVIEPVWRPDCQAIAFGANGRMYLVKADSSEDPVQLNESRTTRVPGSWSSDGRYLALLDVTPHTRTDIWRLEVATGVPEPLLVTDAVEAFPRISPDGRWLAYTSNDGAGQQVFIRPWNRPGGRSQVSTSGGTQPAWSSDSRTLFYRSGDDIEAASIDSGDGPGASRTIVVSGRPAQAVYRPLGSGTEFVFIERGRERQPLTTLRVVFNWHAEVAEALNR